MRSITNVQNICKLPPFYTTIATVAMRLFFQYLFLLTLLSCEKNLRNDLLPEVRVDLTIDLNLPQYIDLQTPAGWAYTNGGLKGIVIQHTGVGNPPYKAFERACPNNDCTVPMVFDGSLALSCHCDNSSYSIIDGSPQTDGHGQFAREYRVQRVGTHSLNISNF